MNLTRRLAAVGLQWGWMLAVLLVVGFIAALAVVANGRGSGGKPVPSAAVATTASTTAGSVVAPVATAKHGVTTKPSGGRPTAPVGFGTVALSSLPSEAAQTWHLIEKGGPFPRAEDGVAYENAQHRLPDRPLGWYREYTVPTPGTSARGARRLVVGQDRAPFWTDDQGTTFVFVDAGS